MMRARTWIGLVACGLVSVGAAAQDEPERGADREGGAEPERGAEREPPADEAPEPRETPDAPPAEIDDEVFIPTEEIPADAEVTFPVNI